MATFKIYDNAGTGANMDATATIAELSGSWGADALKYDDGQYAVYDMAGSNIDVGAQYQYHGSGQFTALNVNFGVNNAVIGEISGLNLRINTNAGESLFNKVINGGNDVMEGNSYGDTIHGGAGDDGILGWAGNDWLFGDDGNDGIIGASGHDYIDGGAGFDTAGFAGFLNEYMFQWQKNGDVVVTDLVGDEGSDYVTATTETLGFISDGQVVDTSIVGWYGNTFYGSAGVDYLEASTMNGYHNVVNGRTGNDYLETGSGNDVIRGGAGDDWIEGGRGTDTLYGDSGWDAFVFATPASSGMDAIKGFNTTQDVIVLENAFFKVGSGLSSSEFRVNNTGKAQDSNDKVIYDRDSGVLYYDADGAGSKGGVAFTTITKGLKLTHHDFDII